ncbi:MAG: hypothetical protein DRP75_04405, partial [Candidatus Omnitrophota bacterium]
WGLIIIFLCVGPFVLPLIWFNPYLKKKAKVIGTFAVLISFYLITILFIKSLKIIFQYYRTLFTF